MARKARDKVFILVLHLLELPLSPLIAERFPVYDILVIFLQASPLLFPLRLILLPFLRSHLKVFVYLSIDLPHHFDVLGGVVFKRLQF